MRRAFLALLIQQLRGFSGLQVAALYVEPRGSYAGLPGVVGEGNPSVELQSKRERNSTPDEFRDVLLDMVAGRGA